MKFHPSGLQLRRSAPSVSLAPAVLSRETISRPSSPSLGLVLALERRERPPISILLSLLCALDFARHSAYIHFVDGRFQRRSGEATV